MHTIEHYMTQNIHKSNSTIFRKLFPDKLKNHNFQNHLFAKKTV